MTGNFDTPEDVRDQWVKGAPTARPTHLEWVRICDILYLGVETIRNYR